MPRLQRPPGHGIDGIKPLTEAVHGLHAGVVNESLTTLDDVGNRTSCYVCHPGFDTQCLRGAMGKAIGADGQFSMDCQSCHGEHSAVGDPDRVGWLEQPECSNCHTGTATNNNGQIRYTSAFDDATGELRNAVSDVFATTPDVPAQGFSLYRFSSSHGGLQCSACHGPPHAIYPTNFANDNVQNELIQGHGGTLTDCTACHAELEDDEVDGPHGMHPVSSKWVRDNHKNEAEHNLAQCMECHGADSRGTVLSYAQGERTYDTQFGQKHFWEGFRVSCYACHDGPDDDDPIDNAPPVVPDRSLSTPNDVPLAVTLNGTDADGDNLSFRIVSQPARGTVGLVGDSATYFPEAGYLGSASFTYAAWDGKTNSNLGSVTVTSTAPNCPGTSQPYGFGCPGAAGFVPTLSVDGCPTPGQSLTLTIENGLGGSTGLLIVGSQRDLREPWAACVLRVKPLLDLQPFSLSAGGPGQGLASLDYSLPAGFSGTLNFQAFVQDFTNGQRGVFTNAWEVVLP